MAAQDGAARVERPGIAQSFYKSSEAATHGALIITEATAV
jgi:hypothetical protein